MKTDSPAVQPTGLRRKLGRGLGSLLSSPVQVETSPAAPVASTTPAITPRPPAFEAKKAVNDNSEQDSGSSRRVAIDRIRPNPHQPRQDFDEAALAALASSIKTSGLMQPIVVRTSPVEQGSYEIIAGERRWRAAQIAELTTLEVVVREVDDRTAAQFSLVENLQREDLNPIERAEAFRRLIQEFQLTHQQIADSVSLDRTSITNHLRLNDLDDFTKDALRHNKLSLGHAKALLAFTNNDRRKAFAERAISQGWSVRETERRVREAVENPPGSTDLKAAPRAGSLLAPHMADLQRRLGEHLGTKVIIRPGSKKNTGTLMIEFFDLDQFEGLMERLQFEMD